jgi:hypothetical protein
MEKLQSVDCSGRAGKTASHRSATAAASSGWLFPWRGSMKRKGGEKPCIPVSNLTELPCNIV